MSTQINSNSSVRTDAKASNVLTTQSAALRGAALAFAKPPVKPKPNNYGGNNGALAAASRAGGSANAPRSSPLTSPTSYGNDERLMLQHSGAGNTYGSSKPGADPTMQRRKRGPANGDMSDRLPLPRTGSSRSVSPSHIAASLAASRSASVTPNHTGQQPTRPTVLHRKTSSLGRSPGGSTSRSRVIPEDALDVTSIPPTTSLIGMFERSVGTTPIIKRPNPGAVKSNGTVVVSPKPNRPQSILVEQRLPDIQKPSLEGHQGSDGGKGARLPSKGPEPSAQKRNEDDAFSGGSFVSAPDQRPQPVLAHKRRPTSVPASADARKIDALANAIVASSLASSRAGSPSKASLNSAPPLPPPRRGNNGLFVHQPTFDTRTPSPSKGLRQTLRKPPKDEDEEDPNMARRGKRNIMKKHPNKHHEGDRKRWRDAITERERKRYEAVWASNKGLHVPSNVDALSFPPPPKSESQASAIAATSPDPSHSVSNIVVRDIWSRSRLGADVLSEVWELVDRTGTGVLSREEFVVGLWLIDQRLKGRKLPVRVGDSVWSSIAALGGIKVRGNGRRR